MTELAPNLSSAPLPVPAEAVGNISNSAEHVRESVVSILDIKEDTEFTEAAHAFTSARLTELEANSSPEIMDYFSHSQHTGFIHPDTVIKPNVYEADETSGFKIDDTSIYVDLLTTLRSLRARDQYRSKSSKDEAFYKGLSTRGIQYTLFNYFGLDPQSEAKHDDTFGLNIGEDTEIFSISELKGKAMCIEYAAVGNNMLNFMGIDGANLIFGRLRRGEQSAHHAYLVMNGSDGRQKVFDPVRPILVKNYDKDVSVVLNPAVFPGAEAILEGGELAVTRVDMTIRDGVKGQEESEYVYSAR